MRNMEKNLKIRMRLLIVFLITILIALALTFLSIRQTIKIQKDYTSILTGPIAITYAVQSSETEVNSIARQLRDMALSGYDTTEMNAHLDREALAALAEETPLGAIGTPEDVAEAIWYLSSDAARFVTGQVLAPNGGLVI